MPDNNSQKSDPTLDMSDLVGASTAHSNPVVDLSQSDSLDLSRAEPAAPADNHVEPPIEPAPPLGEPTKPTDSSPPLFRNPLGAGLSSHLTDFGASAGTAPLRDETPAPTKAFRPNLAPSFDTFAAHGLESDQAPATTLLGKLGRYFKLPKIFSGRNLRYAGIGIASFAIFLLVFNFGTLSTQISYWLNPPQPVAPITTPLVSTASTTTNQAEAAPPGNVVIIPKLNITNVPIVLENSIDENAIQKSLESGVVHYDGTALPGDQNNGNVVIVGHSSNDWWEPGNYKFVFALLDKLNPGDQIQINYQQKKFVYQVSSTEVVEPTEISVLQPTSQPQLTLITCTPPGTSWKRLVVIAKQISPLPDAQPTNTAQNQSSKSTQQAVIPGSAPSFFDQIKQWLGLAKPAATTPSS